MVPFLRRQGVRQLDTLMVSHGDNDHIGGVASLVKAYPPRRILSSVPGQVPGRQAAFCRRGEGWQWDGVRFAVLHPTVQPGESANNASCVLHIEAAGGGRLPREDRQGREGEGRAGRARGRDIRLEPTGLEV